MSIIGTLLNVILHLDKYLNLILQNYGMWTYSIIFLIIFCETGLVITPFLPGDSIIFATGALASIGSLSIINLFIIFFISAIAGDALNYYIGKKIGDKILEKEDVKYINKEYLKKAHVFYARHGSMTIVLGRFIPVIRTFVPFIAGIGKMGYSKFIIYNMLGGFLWVTLFLGGGYFFGGLPFVKQHFSYVVIAIVIISIIPAIVMLIKEKRNGGNNGDDVINTAS
jgi:membrane-associated protein